MSIKSRIDNIFQELRAGKITIKLENETLFLSQQQVLGLTVEAINNIAGNENKELSELARKVKKARPGELRKLPNILKNL